jgi:hypothetical protein
MITDINNKSKIFELNIAKLPQYWKEYFEYNSNIELSNLAMNEFLNEIVYQKTKEKPFIDSQILISRLLTEFGKKHIFHRKFKEEYPNLNSAQILGMQLYHIIVQDDDEWKYYETREKNHLFPHATYFK